MCSWDEPPTRVQREAVAVAVWARTFQVIVVRQLIKVRPAKIERKLDQNKGKLSHDQPPRRSGRINRGMRCGIKIFSLLLLAVDSSADGAAVGCRILGSFCFAPFFF